MENRRLYRSNKNKVFFGVCGGVGEYFNIDPVLIRIVVLVLLFCRPWSQLFHSVLGMSIGGAVVIGYFVAAVIIPKHPRTE